MNSCSETWVALNCDNSLDDEMDHLHFTSCSVSKPHFLILQSYLVIGLIYYIKVVDEFELASTYGVMRKKI
jgi:hypothetical protein